MDVTTLVTFITRLCKIGKSDCELRHVCLSAWKNSAPTGRIFVKFDIRRFFENLYGKFKFE